MYHNVCWIYTKCKIKIENKSVKSHQQSATFASHSSKRRINSVRERKRIVRGEMGLIVTISGGWRKCEALWNRESVFNDIARSRCSFPVRDFSIAGTRNFLPDANLSPRACSPFISVAAAGKNVRSLLTKDIKLPIPPFCCNNFIAAPREKEREV